MVNLSVKYSIKSNVNYFHEHFLVLLLCYFRLIEGDVRAILGSLNH
jgi:hypothetical protein